MKAILFDNDGVLVDTERLYFQANLEMFAQAGFELTAAMYREFNLLGSGGAWYLAEQGGVDPAAFPSMRESRNARYAELLRNEEILIPGAREAVIALAREYRLGIVTSSRRDHFEIIHERTGLMPHFDFVVAQGDYERSKPAPDPYLMGIERSGASPSECVAIEDSARGLTAAKAAGLTCWVVPSGMTVGQDFTAADRMLGSLGELVAALGSVGRGRG